MKLIFIAPIILFLLVASFFTAKIPFDSSLAIVSSISVVAFALPSFYFLIKNVGLKYGLFILITLGLYAFIVEYIAVKTGFPYGEFQYESKIGFKIFDTVPWTVPFAWTPLLLGTYTIARRVTKSTVNIILISSLMLVLVDMVIDPASVKLIFWTWQYPFGFYNVPWSNFIGWFISGCGGSIILHAILTKLKNTKLHINVQSSLLFILVFWVSICFWLSLYIPALIGTTLLIVSYFKKYSDSNH